jgi:hypothetical protein
MIPRFFVTLTLTLGTGVAEEHPIELQIVPSLTETSPFGGVPLLEKLAAARKAGITTTAPEADGVFRSAMLACRRFLSIELPSPKSMATFTHAGQDILIARWTGDLPLGSKSMTLWDDPSSTSLLIRLPAVKLQNPDSLKALMQGLIRWDRSRLGPLYLFLSRTHYPGRDFLRGGATNTFPRQFVFPTDLTIAGDTESTGTWFSVTLSADATSVEFLDHMKGIPERFPPLESRIPRWSTARLLVAMKEPDPWPDMPRISILLHEAVSRDDLSMADFRDLVDRCVAAYCSKGERVPGAIIEAVGTPSGSRFLPAIIDYFREETSWESIVRELRANEFMRALNRSGNPGYCTVVMGFLADHLAVVESRKYADRFCTSKEGLKPPPQ